MRIGRGDLTVGREIATSELCQECHGLDGNSASSSVPKLAGQYSQYMIEQLRSFRSGERKSDTMKVMASSLDEQDWADVAAHFASQKVMSGGEVKNLPRAQKLFEVGDPEREIPACASCHGERGKGTPIPVFVAPIIGGQQNAYLRGQLANWKIGERSSSDKVMNRIAVALSREEIDELAEYIAGF